jgi:quercetin dioxygenase-like cupin family protein
MQRPFAVQESTLDWEHWPDELVAKRGAISWRTLVSGDRTPSAALTVGVARLAPGETLEAHRHEQAEVYVGTAGEGTVTIEGEAFAVAEGTALFIPGNALHACENTGAEELRFVYVLAADSFADVDYRF